MARQGLLGIVIGFAGGFFGGVVGLGRRHHHDPNDDRLRRSEAARGPWHKPRCRCLHRDGRRFDVLLARRRRLESCSHTCRISYPLRTHGGSLCPFPEGNTPEEGVRSLCHLRVASAPAEGVDAGGARKHHLLGEIASFSYLQASARASFRA